MKRLFGTLGATALLLAALAPAARADEAAKRRKAEARAAKQFRKLEVSGDQVIRSIEKLTALRWHRSLEAAQEAARASGKPILWIQALGEIDGFL